MKNKYLLALAALATTQAFAAGNTFSDIQIDNLKPKSGEPITLSFPGLTSQCAVTLSASNFTLASAGLTAVNNGKLSFVAKSSSGDIYDGPFTLTVSPGIGYGENCQGQVKSFQIEVNANRIGMIQPESFNAVQGQPTNIVLSGNTGRNCDGALVDFGDGTTQQVAGVLPIKVAHTYNQPGSYKLAAKPTGATCWGEVYSDRNANVANLLALTSLGANLSASYTNPQRTAVKITVPGSAVANASCERAYVNWGDGSSPEPVSGNFPLTASHQYQADGMREIVVKAADGFKCAGEIKSSMYIYPAQDKFSAIVQVSTNAQPNQDVMLELAGSGICENVSVDAGDGLNIVSLGQLAFNPYNNFKYPVKLKYAKTGSYTLQAKDSGASHCGIVMTKVVVSTPRQAPAAFNLPLIQITPITPATPASAPKPKPKAAAKTCAKKLGQQIDPNCVED
jgi:hypothetical protein